MTYSKLYSKYNHANETRFTFFTPVEEEKSLEENDDEKASNSTVHRTERSGRLSLLKQQEPAIKVVSYKAVLSREPRHRHDDSNQLKKKQ